MKKSHIATLIVFLVLIPLTLILGSRLSGRSPSAGASSGAGSGAEGSCGADTVTV